MDLQGFCFGQRKPWRYMALFVEVIQCAMATFDALYIFLYVYILVHIYVTSHISRSYTDDSCVRVFDCYTKYILYIV